METREQIEKFKEFFEKSYLTELNKISREQRKSFNVDFRELEIEEPELSEEILKQPEEVIKAAELSLDDLNIPDKNLRVRLFNLPKAAEIKIRNIRSIDLGRFLSFDGIVRQSSDVRPQVTNARFECPSCGNVISILQMDQKFKEPSRCTCGRRGQFRMISKDLVDAQRLVLEEPPETLEGGEQPKRLSVFLKEDLVEPHMERKTTPGSKRIKVSGVVKEVPIQLKTGAQSIRYDIAADAIHVEPIEQTYEDIEVTEEDKEKIHELAKDPALFDRLVNSICPSVYGYADTKEALVLQLAGGVKRERPDGTKLRGDVHILLVGDPGAAKSTMLTFMEKAAPKARYVAGRSTSGAGITATVVKDEFLRGWALEAGAVVLANKGLLLIDEMDKMSIEDTSALHEAMAQQQVTISKANIQATLRAQTSILAAANPKLGRFDPFQPIAQQIDLPPALINRFDLIFPVRDLPSKEVDEKIALHILEQDFKGKAPEIPTDFMKKYVSYCKHIDPKLTKQAIQEIKNFYVGLRNSGGPSEGKIKPIPISARQLESIIRLAEASARIRLSEQVTQADAQRAIRLVTYCLTQVGIDPETGQIDIDRISTGITANQRSRISVIREIIDHLEKKVGKSIPIEDIVTEAGEKGLSESQVEEVIERFKREGYIFEPKRGQLSKL